MAKARRSPPKEAPLGEGGRFAAIEKKAAARGAKNPGGVAYSAGVKAHGKAEMTRLAKIGKKKRRKKAKK